jgi:hypothetical protein
MGSGRWRSAGASAVVLGTAVLLGACGSNGNTATAPTLDASAAPSTTATTERLVDADGRPLTDAEAQAFREATEVVVAYEQTFYDILAAQDPDLNRMNLVAVQPQLDIDLRSLQKIVTRGGFTVESSGPTALVDARPIFVRLRNVRSTISLEACIDQSAAFGSQGTKEWTGPRERATYEVVAAPHLSPTSWAVARVTPPEGEVQPQKC